MPPHVPTIPNNDLHLRLNYNPHGIRGGKQHMVIDVGLTKSTDGSYAFSWANVADGDSAPPRFRGYRDHRYYSAENGLPKLRPLTDAVAGAAGALARVLRQHPNHFPDEHRDVMPGGQWVVSLMQPTKEKALKHASDSWGEFSKSYPNEDVKRGVDALAALGTAVFRETKHTGWGPF